MSSTNRHHEIVQADTHAQVKTYTPRLPGDEPRLEAALTQ